MKNILVIQTAFLGDVILATALAEKLHLCFPSAGISMLVREGNESLLSNHPFLKEVLVWKKKSGKLSGLLDTIRTVRKNEYDAVFNLQRFFSSGLITALSGAAIRAGFRKNPWSFRYTHVGNHTIGDNRHEVTRNLELLSGMCDTIKVSPRLYPSPAEYEKVLPLQNQLYITMAPASVWFTKQLPAGKWMEMIRSADPGLLIYLLGAPGDRALCEKIIADAGSSRALNMAGKLTLLETAALMGKARMNYVNDSGPLHIASAMNAPVTAFFCSTVPAFGFGPLSDQSTIVETPEVLDCRPCGLHGRNSCPRGHFKCATTIRLPVPGIT